MPQTNYLPLYKAGYPLLAPVQKPGGVTVSTTLIATAVPNKPTYVAGTIQMVGMEVEKPAPEEEEVDEEEEEETPPPTRGGRGRSR
jgi:hypothetical protein